MRAHAFMLQQHVYIHNHIYIYALMQVLHAGVYLAHKHETSTRIFPYLFFTLRFLLFDNKFFPFCLPFPPIT